MWCRHVCLWLLFQRRGLTGFVLPETFDCEWSTTLFRLLAKKVNEVYFLSLCDFIFLSDYFSRFFPFKLSPSHSLSLTVKVFFIHKLWRLIIWRAPQTPQSAHQTALSLWFWCFLSDIMTFSHYNLLLHDVSGDSAEFPSTTCWLRSSTAFIWTPRDPELSNILIGLHSEGKSWNPKHLCILKKRIIASFCVSG